jgi:hypothetical protein
VKFDLGAEMAAHARRRSQREAVDLVDIAMERKLVAALLGGDLIALHRLDPVEGRWRDTEPVPVISLCEDVETDDLTDFRLRAVFNAIRVLQARGEAIGVLQVHDEIARTDLENAAHVGAVVDLLFLVTLLAEPKFSENGLGYVKQKLRELAAHRRLA